MLYLIPTVLAEGTQQQIISPAVLEILPKLKFFLVENVRSARRFLASLKLGIEIDQLCFEVLDKDSKAHEIEGVLVKWHQEGHSIGLLSEAGCPAVADPGALAVYIAHKINLQVQPLVGPSAILLALMGSGFSGQSFAFHGYLPIDNAEKIKAINVLLKNALTGQSQIFMETPFRNAQLFDTLLQVLPANQKLCVACNITAPDQLILTKTISYWKLNKPDIHKKPTVFVIG
jgi:16S rRNA (cytidine1402-2'-O)-methyltransferase